MFLNKKYLFVFGVFFLLISCNQSDESEKSNKDILVDGSWIIYDIESNESENNLGLILGVFIMGQLDFESIKFNSDGFYEAYSTQGESIFSEEYLLNNNELILSSEGNSQTHQVKKLDANNLILESQDGIVTKLRKK